MTDARIVALDNGDPEVAVEIVELQRRAYRVEAELIGSAEIPALSETPEQLQRSREQFLGAYVDSVLAGFVSWKIEGLTLDLHRLVVDPAHFRRGIGTALLQAALVAEPHARRAIVQTGAANVPAKVFYERHGFREVGRREVAPGLIVALFERDLA